MMEAARLMDEQGTGETTGVATGCPAREQPGGASGRVRLVATQARPAGDGGDPAGPPFRLLQSSADVLLLRPLDVRASTAAAGARRVRSRSNRAHTSSCARD